MSPFLGDKEKALVNGLNRINAPHSLGASWTEATASHTSLSTQVDAKGLVIAVDRVFGTHRRPLRGGRSGDIVPRPSRLVPRRLYYSLEDAIEAAESEYAAVVVAVEVTVKEQITRTTTCRQ